MQEVICRGDLAEHHEGLFRRGAAAIEQHRHRRDQAEPEELAEQRTIVAAAYRALVQPGQDEPHQDRAEHGQHAPQLRRQDEVRRESAQDRVERPEIPFGHDMCRGRERVRFDIVVRVAQRIGHEEHHGGEEQQHHAQPETVLGGVIGMERNGVALALHFHARRVRGARDVQRPDVQDDHCRDHEGQQVVQAEEAVERRIVRGKTAQQPDLQWLANQRDRAEQAGDDLGAPEAHLAPGKDIAHEGGRHHQQEDHDAQQPDHLARGLVRTVEEAAEDVQVDHDEEEAGAVGMRITHQPAPVHIAHDVFDLGKCDRRVRCVMHRQDDPGDDLQDQEEPGQHAKVPHVIEVARHRISGTDCIVDETRKR